MAGDDWIRMRTDLYRDPKVLVIAKELMRNGSEFALRNGDVTRNVTRNAVCGALLSVWGVCRHRGRRSGDALSLSGVTLSDLDDIADVPGFGEAMAAAGWAEESTQGVTLPGFFNEYNSEPKRSKAAERQRKYREKKRVTRDVTRDVTQGATVTGEKRREEREKSNTPPTPPGGVKVEDLVIPARLDTPESRERLGEWLAHKRSRRKGYRDGKYLSRHLESFSTAGELCASINTALASNYDGFHPPKKPNSQGDPFAEAQRILDGESSS